MTTDQAITLSLSGLALAVSLYSLVYGTVVDRRIARRRSSAIAEIQCFNASCGSSTLELDASPARKGRRA